MVSSNAVDYYTLLDLELIGRNLYGDAFAKWLMSKDISTDFLFRLAEETSVVLLPGHGFEDTHPSARVSLANLRECDYKNIGCFTRRVIDEYYRDFEAAK